MDLVVKKTHLNIMILQIAPAIKHITLQSIKHPWDASSPGLFLVDVLF
jgi:hypothetical protein